jgi:membrane protein
MKGKNASDKFVLVTVNRMKHWKAGLRKTKRYMQEIPTVQLIARTDKESGNHDAGQRAGGVAYYTIISIFPLLLGLTAIFGFFLRSLNLQDELLKFVGNNIPGSTNILKENIANIIRLRGIMSILSIVILFWSASALFDSISLAINRAWNISISRHFFVRKASELSMVFGTGILFLKSLGASTIITIMQSALILPAAYLIIVYTSTKLVVFLLVFSVFLLLYKFVPNTKTYWRSVWPGALLAAVLFELARTLFIFYLDNFANYQLIYGSITSIIILLIWIYYSAFVMILGAEFTFQYSRMR